MITVWITGTPRVRWGVILTCSFNSEITGGWEGDHLHNQLPWSEEHV